MRLLQLRPTSVFAVGVLLVSMLSTLAFGAGVARAAPSAWSIIHSPNPSKSKSLFADVSCANSTFCVAVGWRQGGGNGKRYLTLVETSNGSSWSVASSQNPSRDDVLDGVSCTGAMSCIAVGDAWNTGKASYATLVESWNGTSWSVVPSPDPSTSSELSGVSCTSPSFCVAVGSDDGHGATLVETWDGANWTVTPSLNVAPSTGVQLGRVSCTSSSSCVAVGYYDDASTLEQTLIESWDGTSWTVIPSPNVGTINYLDAVSCINAMFCITVGASGLSAPETLIETWDGTNWTVTPSPNPSKRWNVLSTISCASDTSCVSTGWSYSRGIDRTLIETWDESTWSITPSPTRTCSFFLAGGISCPDSTNCTAVGYFTTSAGAARTLVLEGSTP